MGCSGSTNENVNNDVNVNVSSKSHETNVKGSSGGGHIVMQQAQGGFKKEWCSATMGGTCSLDENGVCKMCKEKKTGKGGKENGGIVMQQASGGYNKNWCSATMGGTCNLDSNGVCTICGESKGLKKESEVQNVEQNNGVNLVMQEADGGFREEWCSATMGGTCDLNEQKVCKRCGTQR